MRKHQQLRLFSKKGNRPRTLSCYAFADSKAVGAPGDNLISAFICFCPCLSNALKSCSDAWEQLGMLGIERNSGAIMVSGPIALFGKKGEVVDASASGKRIAGKGSFGYTLTSLKKLKIGIQELCATKVT